jgi:hypothetical protein
MTRAARREDQRVADPPPVGLRVEQQAHAAEVDLDLVARIPIGNANGGCPASARPAQLRGEPLEGPGWDRDPLPEKEIPDFGHRQVFDLEPGLDLFLVLLQQPPGFAVTIETVRADLLHHHRQELVGELVLAADPVQPGLHRRRHVTADSLAVHPRQPLHAPEPMVTEPQAQDFTNLEHTHLPEGHRRSSIR